MRVAGVFVGDGRSLHATRMQATVTRAVDARRAWDPIHHSAGTQSYTCVAVGIAGVRGPTAGHAARGAAAERARAQPAAGRERRRSYDVRLADACAPLAAQALPRSHRALDEAVAGPVRDLTASRALPGLDAVAAFVRGGAAIAVDEVRAIFAGRGSVSATGDDGAERGEDRDGHVDGTAEARYEWNRIHAKKNPDLRESYSSG